MGHVFWSPPEPLGTAGTRLEDEFSLCELGCSLGQEGGALSCDEGTGMDPLAWGHGHDPAVPLKFSWQQKLEQQTSPGSRFFSLRWPDNPAPRFSQRGCCWGAALPLLGCPFGTPPTPCPGRRMTREVSWQLCPPVLPARSAGSGRHPELEGCPGSREGEERLAGEERGWRWHGLEHPRHL